MIKNDLIITLVANQVAAADNMNDALRQVSEMINAVASNIVYDTDEKGYGRKTVTIKTFKVMVNA